MATAAPTPIVEKRSIVMTVILAVVGAGLLAMAGAIAIKVAFEVPAAWSGVALFAIPGLVVAAMAWFAHYFEAACPHCQRAVGFDSEDDGERVACQACRSLIVARGKQAHATDDDLVLDRAEFGTWILSGMQMPNICAQCGGAATHVVKFKQRNTEWAASLAMLAGSLASGGLAIGGATSSTSGGVPHCDAHDSGFDVTYDDGVFTLWVRSFAFVKELSLSNQPMIIELFTKRPTKKGDRPTTDAGEPELRQDG